MFRYQILIEYVGSSFIGWQVQKKGKTIQGLIQKKISKLLDEKIIVTGSGRTDAGVHAIEQSAHFDCMNEIKNLKKFLNSINYFLNKNEIAILKIKKQNLKDAPPTQIASRCPISLHIALDVPHPQVVHVQHSSMAREIFSLLGVDPKWAVLSRCLAIFGLHKIWNHHTDPTTPTQPRHQPG